MTNNHIRFSVLLLIYAAEIKLLGMAGVNDLSSPWLWVLLIPSAALSLAERSGKVSIFNEMTLSALLVVTSTTLVASMLNSHNGVPDWLGHTSIAAMIIALSFSIFCIWTYAERPN